MGLDMYIYKASKPIGIKTDIVHDYEALQDRDFSLFEVENVKGEKWFADLIPYCVKVKCVAEYYDIPRIAKAYNLGENAHWCGFGCGKIVQEVSRHMVKVRGLHVGFKADLTKYFDTVPIRYIDKIFDRMEAKVGKSKIIDIVRKYYHTDLCFDFNGDLIEHYQSLKQGCAVASFLADAVLYHLDSVVSMLPGYYVRYSDDLLYVGGEWGSAFQVVKSILADMEMTLNPKKVEQVYKDRWVKFLGFSIKGDMITLSKSRVKSFQKEIEARTIKQRNISERKAVNQVQSYLYKGDGTYSWATSVLPIINVDKDIDTLNEFVMDCIRACATGKKKIGGLGSVNDKSDHTILRGTGKNVTANRNKTAKEIEGYLSIRCMQNALLTRRAVFETLVRSM